jgi:hypothetical protein
MIRPLEPADAEALIALRQAALVSEPLAFSAVPGGARSTLPFVTAALADRDEQAVFGPARPASRWRVPSAAS